MKACLNLGAYEFVLMMCPASESFTLKEQGF